MTTQANARKGRSPRGPESGLPNRVSLVHPDVKSGHPRMPRAGPAEMKRDWISSELWHSLLQWSLGGIGLALMTFACLRLEQDIHVAAFGYLTLILLLALRGGFIASAVLCIVAAGLLSFFFAPPLFSFWVDKSGGRHRDRRIPDDFISRHRPHPPAQSSRGNSAQSAGGPRPCLAHVGLERTDRLDRP